MGGKKKGKKKRGRNQGRRKGRDLVKKLRVRGFWYEEKRFEADW